MAAAIDRARHPTVFKRYAWRIAIVLGVAVAAVDSFALPATGHVIIKCGGSLIAAVGIGLAIRLWKPRSRRLWMLLFISLSVWTAGWVMAASPLISTGTYADSPSIADVFWLGSYLLLGIGMLILLGRREKWHAVLIDVAAIVASLGVISAVFLIAPYLATTDLPAGQRITHVVYVAFDLVNFALALRLLLAPKPRDRSATLVILAAFAFLVSDFIWNWLTLSGTYATGTWADAGWVAAPLFLAAAALHPSMRLLADHRPVRTERLGVSSAVLLGLAALSGTEIHDVFRHGSHAATTRTSIIALSLVGGLVAVLILARVATLVRHSQRLASELNDALEERGRLLDQSQSLLDQSQSRYQMLVEHLPAVIFRLGRERLDGPFVPLYVSPQAKTIIGVDAADMTARPKLFGGDVHPDDRELVATAEDRLATGLETRPFEFRVMKTDSEPVWLRSEQRLIHNRSGLYVQGFLLDVTPQKNAEADRDRLELDLRLAQKLESVGQLAAGIAHEINTPIQFVGDTIRFLDDAFTDLMELVALYGRQNELAREAGLDQKLLGEVAESEEQADIEYLTERVPKAFERAADGIQRVAAIVGAMRAFAHPPASEKAPVDINEALRNTLVVAASEYKYLADVDIQLGDIPEVVCDAGDMNQVFLNVVVNAAHAIQDAVGDTGDRGTITIATRVDGEEAVVEIGDTGTGIPDEVVGRVFDPFFTTKEIGRGTGQGLALVRAIVTDRHDGRVLIHTAEGAGTTFEIRLPLHPVETTVEGIAA